VEDGRNGLLCEPNDIGDIARALDRALGADSAELLAMSRRACEAVRRRHDADRYARDLAELLRELAVAERARETVK
jgi:glycosyltransferase involved in cell wall biosynthesis